MGLGGSKKRQLPLGGQLSGRGCTGTIELLFSVVVFMFSGPLLVIINRFYLKGSGGFPHPLFLSAVGVLWSGFLARVLVGLELFQVKECPASTWKLVILGLCSSLSMSSGNAAYLYSSVASIQMLKAGSPVIVMIILHLSGLERLTMRAQAAILIMAASAFATFVGEVSFQWIGLGLMVAAEVLDGVRLMLTQSFLKKTQGIGVMDGLYYLQPILGAWLIIASAAAGELRIIWSERAYETFLRNLHQTLMLLFLAFTVNISSYLVIKATSGLFLKLLVAVRNVGLVIFATAFYEEPITGLQICAYTITLLSFLAYSYFKMRP